jgi:hypothetical protein
LSSSPVDFVAQSTNRSPLDFEVQIKKTIVVILSLKSPNHSFDFDAQTSKSEATGFKTKPGETVATSFDDKSEESGPLILRSNH